MSGTSGMNRLTEVSKAGALWPPIRILAKGRLAVGTVTLPEGSGLTGSEDTFAERLVFFEAQGVASLGEQLQELLSTVWCIDTSWWLEHGLICNVFSVQDAIAQGGAHGLPEELALFECGAGSASFGVGPDLIHYWREADIDLFVTPRVAERLRCLISMVEGMYRENSNGPTI